MTKAELLPLIEREDDEVDFVCPGCGEIVTRCTCGGEACWQDIAPYLVAQVLAIGLCSAVLWWFAF